MKLSHPILFFTIAISSLIYGQENINEKFKFKYLSITDGLSQSSVLSILQDSAGFMWFGTRDGLNKFDGHSFKIYRHNSQNYEGISNSFIKSMIEDSEGNLWVGTMNGLNKYIPSKDTFEKFELATNDYGISNHEIWDIIQVEDGFLWLGTNYGLEKFDMTTGNTKRYLSDKTSNSISSNEIRSFMKDDKGLVWICTTSKIDVLNTKTNSYEHYEYPLGAFKEESSSYKPYLYQDKQGDIWLGYKNGLYILNRQIGLFEKFQISDGSISKINDEVRTIVQDRLGKLWVGTYNGGYVIDKTSASIVHFQHDKNDIKALSQNSIYDIIEDTKGDMWIGTYAGGVNYFDRSYDVFKHFSVGNNTSRLNYKVVSAIVEDENRNLWIGTEGGGLNFYDHKTGLFRYYKHKDFNSTSLSNDNVKTILKTKKGNLWIGTHDGGLNFCNPRKKPIVFKSYKNDVNDAGSLNNNRVISILEDHKTNIWIGTSGGGFSMFDSKTQIFLKIQDPLNLVGNYVHCIVKTSDKNTILIGGEKGLAKLNINTKKLKAIHYKEVSDAYSTNAVFCAFEDANKNIWIGTEGDGLYCYKSDIQKSIRYGVSNGLTNEVIYSILPEETNKLWLSTNHGLSRFDLQKNKFKNFDVKDGLINGEFNNGARIRLSNGTYMFGGTNGIDFFDSQNIEKNSFVPPVSITSVYVDNEEVSLSKDSVKEIVVDYDQNVFTFHFIALNYTQPTKNKYAYKLDGFNTDWNYIGNNKSATYTNLDAGSYTFQVKASNNDDVWNEEGVAVSVLVLPAPWKTWWAYILYVSFGFVGFYFVTKFSIIRINEKNELRQERIEKERMEEVNQMKLKLFTNISHDFRTPLTLIIGPLERMLADKLGDKFIQEQHGIMYRNASALLQLINQLLDFRKSESGKLKLNASKGNIVPFIEDVKLSFEELAKVRNINYNFKTSNKSIDLWFDKVNLKKVVFNLLSNAFKFTQDGGKISIKISVSEKKRPLQSNTKFLKIVVKDNGKGIPEKNIKAVFERYYQLGEDENTRGGSGIGLSLCKNLVKLHHGTIKVKSQEGVGTSFIVLLPFGNKHLSKQEIIPETFDTKDEKVGESPFVYNKELLQNHEQIVQEDQIDSNLDASRPTLLLVDDNSEVRSFIKLIFKEKHNVLEAENGSIALTIAKDKDIDLIISDVMMPIMDGVELCKRIKSDIITSHIPVILLTAKTSEDAQKQGFTFGADAYITKPFDAAVLELRVLNLLKSRSKLNEKLRKDIIMQPKELNVTSADEIFLQKAIDLVEDNLSNYDFSVNDFINLMGVSRSVLYRKLKALTNQSLTEFIRTIKLKRAAQLLIKSQMNISEIAFSLGFNDLKHFRKSFQKLFDELPSEYRKNNGLE
ncbi:MAG: hybrid sensor histidine kinase/response regulator transcription factor, partial [Flavicella sp.]